jgi:hypothetical protein
MMHVHNPNMILYHYANMLPIIFIHVPNTNQQQSIYIMLPKFSFEIIFNLYNRGRIIRNQIMYMILGNNSWKVKR